jgi:predicted metal-dependent enzyme (double-stranded beta helix superfamily)
LSVDAVRPYRGDVFDVEAFLAELVACGAADDARRATHDTLARTLSSSSGEVAAALAPPEGGITLLHHAPDLTIANIAWAPHMRLMPHDHRMWAVIGIYGGTEDNQFFRRDADGGLAATNDRRLDAGDVCVLGTQTIHAVTNPTGRLTGAIHVYGGDFVNQPRSQWGPGDLVERPFSMETLRRQFADANDAATALDA